MTIWAARANFMEREIGSISPGKYADFVVMDRDWLKAPTAAIMGTNVLSTHSGAMRVDRAGFGITARTLRRARPGGCACLNAVTG